jgi:hypothetical protein
MCSVLSLTFNKYDHLKETKSIIIPVINSRTFNDIFDEHHDFGLKNNQCKVMESSEYRSVCLGLTWQWNCYLKNKSKQEASTYTFNKKNHSNSHCFSASWNPQVPCCLQSLVNSSCINFSASFMSDVRKSLNYNTTHLAYMLQSSVQLQAI